jgi:hypothetical protein
MALKPKRDAAKIDSEWVSIDTVDAMRDNISHCFTRPFWGGFFFAGAYSRKFPCDPPSSREQEMTGTTGWIAHTN